MDITTVADDLIVVHDGLEVIRLEHLEPSTTHHVRGHDITTRARPAGALLCRFATVNDVHFGETECGKIDNDPNGPIQRPLHGEASYPDTMNQGAVAEIATIDPTVVIVKGDLTNAGRPEEFAAFEACYRTAFDDKLHVVRGNHDAYEGQHEYAGDRWIEMPGVVVALIDTTIARHTTGTITDEQIDWLDDHLANTDRPVIVMGHHQQWIPGGDMSHRGEDYFGLHPDASDALDELFARRTKALAYTAGHTHRHRVRHMSCGAPSIEIGCVKDFPGTWAEYRVYEGGIDQVVHRISTPDALSWSERCRHLYSDFAVDYESYALGTLEDRCCTIPLR
ncbi:MAG: metallophosphoesterase [Actinomycetota bacterium]